MSRSNDKSFKSFKSFKWFHGSKVPKKQSINLYTIALSRQDALLRIKQDPSCLFHVANSYIRHVDESYFCDGDDEEVVENETFLDLLIQYKTIREQDIVDMVDLDWFKLSPLLPLSTVTLEKYSERVDWSGISASCLYNKTERFIRSWAKRLDWKCMTKVNIDSKLLAQLVFEENIVPLEYGLQHLKSREAIKYIDRVLDMLNGSPDVIMAFIERYGIACIDGLYIDNDERLCEFKAEIYNANATGFANMCCQQKYIPKSHFFQHVLKLAYADGNWTEFLRRCKPDLDFIVQHIVANGASHDETWAVIADRKLPEEFLMAHKAQLDPMILMRYNQLDAETLRGILKNSSDAGLEELSKVARLSPEIIDEYAERLDWYHLCEHQDLPEWLMNKYVDKLNWGQVSWYQKMSREFMNVHLRFLNPVKLAANKKMKN